MRKSCTISSFMWLWYAEESGCMAGLSRLCLSVGGGWSTCRFTCSADPQWKVQPTPQGVYWVCSPLLPTLSRKPSPLHHLKLKASSIFISPFNVNPSSPHSSPPNRHGLTVDCLFLTPVRPPCPPSVCLSCRERGVNKTMCGLMIK